MHNLAVFFQKTPPYFTWNVCPNAHADNKIIICLKDNVQEYVLQIDEAAINETFESTNNIFDSFRIFSSDLFLQILDWVTSISENFLK